MKECRMQRALDVVLSLFALILLSPLLVVVSFILKLTGEGEVLFRQIRIGKEGEPFQILKFATMLKNSNLIASGDITIENDPRVLPVGKFLRCSKINELPQLINVLKGDMSIVGPRPLTVSTFSSYPLDLKNEILRVSPGLSGIGSIAFRNEEDLLHSENNPIEFYSEVISPYKGQLEVWYVKNKNIKIYLKVIFITIYVVITSDVKILWSSFPSLPKPPDELNIIRAVKP